MGLRRKYLPTLVLNAFNQEAITSNNVTLQQITPRDCIVQVARRVFQPGTLVLRVLRHVFFQDATPLGCKLEAWAEDLNWDETFCFSDMVVITTRRYSLFQAGNVKILFADNKIQNRRSAKRSEKTPTTS